MSLDGTRRQGRTEHGFEHDQESLRRLGEATLELLGSGLSISCFRYRPAGPPAQTDETALCPINRRILDQLIGEGRVYMSPTTLEGRFSLRVCIVNFRTRRRDIDMLVSEVLRIGRILTA